MMQVIMTAKAHAFELLESTEGSDIGASFIATEKVFIKGELTERRWLVWVKKHQMKWAQRVIGEGKYSVVIIADLFMPDLNFTGSLRMSDIQSV